MAAVGRDPDGVICTWCVNAAEKSGWLSHAMWADDFVLVAENVDELEVMGNDAHAFVQQHGEATSALLVFPRTRNK